MFRKSWGLAFIKAKTDFLSKFSKILPRKEKNPLFAAYFFKKSFIFKGFSDFFYFKALTFVKK